MAPKSFLLAAVSGAALLASSGLADTGSLLWGAVNCRDDKLGKVSSEVWAWKDTISLKPVFKNYLTSGRTVYWENATTQFATDDITPEFSKAWLFIDADGFNKTSSDSVGRISIDGYKVRFTGQKLEFGHGLVCWAIYTAFPNVSTTGSLPAPSNAPSRPDWSAVNCVNRYLGYKSSEVWAWATNLDGPVAYKDHLIEGQDIYYWENRTTEFYLDNTTFTKASLFIDAGAFGKAGVVGNFSLPNYTVQFTGKEFHFAGGWTCWAIYTFFPVNPVPTALPSPTVTPSVSKTPVPDHGDDSEMVYAAVNCANSVSKNSQIWIFSDGVVRSSPTSRVPLTQGSTVTWEGAVTRFSRPYVTSLDFFSIDKDAFRKEGVVGSFSIPMYQVTFKGKQFDYEDGSVCWVIYVAVPVSAMATVPLAALPTIPPTIAKGGLRAQPVVGAAVTTATLGKPKAVPSIVVKARPRFSLKPKN